jgi:uncharacterized membrane protein
VGICFIGLILILFFEKFDYILYSVLFLVIASIVSAVFIEEAREIMFYIESLITPEIQIEEHTRFLGPAVR